jgi:hypothetical protein
MTPINGNGSSPNCKELVERVKQAAQLEGFNATPAMAYFSRWLRWASDNDEKALPVTVESLTRFLLHQAANGVSGNQLLSMTNAIGFCHSKCRAGLNRHLIEEKAWRAFSAELLISAQGPGVTIPPDSELARRAMERADARNRNSRREA